MDAKDLLVDDRRKGEDVEDVLEALPHLDVEAPLALVVEAVDAVDRRALVVAAQQEEVLRVLDLVREEEADALEAVLPAVDVVAEEEVVGVGRKAAVLEHAQQVVVLAVDVAADLDRRLELEERGLRDQHLLRLGDDELDLVGRQLHRAAGLLVALRSGAQRM